MVSSRSLLYLSFLFFVVSICLYGASAGVDRHSRNTTVPTDETIIFVLNNFYLGPYRFTSSEQHTLIDMNCNIKTDSSVFPHILVTQNSETGANVCTLFNAFRFLFSIAGVLSFFSFILVMTTAFCSSTRSAGLILAIIFGLLSTAAGIASFAIFIVFQKNERKQDDYQLGFWLHIGATFASFLASLLAMPSARPN